MAAAVNQAMLEALHVVGRDLQGRSLGSTNAPALAQTASSTSNAPTATPTTPPSSGGGPASSPLLFFVALGFGVVFTNLWIIVGVKYCFRYNARNRAIRNGEEIDPIHLDAMPTGRPHRRRREKKLMTMDEVNERFPLTKYKTWVASRAREGLPTTGGVTAPPSRAVSLRGVDGAMPASPVETKHSVNTRPATAASAVEGVKASPATAENEVDRDLKNAEVRADAKEHFGSGEESNRLSEVRTTASTVDKQATVEDDDDDDDHIHTAVPPELLTNPGDSCAICIDTLEDDDDIRGLTCGHAFHAGCLDPWLTSRRACCPLCKADYYTPKPRPEGEAALEAERQRRRDARANMPQAPSAAWIGLRGTGSGGRMLLLTSRGGTTQVFQHDQLAQDQTRRGRRARGPAGATPAQDGPVAQASEGSQPAENTAAPASNRWRPRNPFGSMTMPTMRLPGRNRQETASTEQNPTATANPSPSQLEAGIR